MNLFLVAGQNLDTDLNSKMAFLVHANNRQQAKSKVQHFCKEQGWRLSSFLNSYDLSNLLEDTELVRIDHLVR